MAIIIKWDSPKELRSEGAMAIQKLIGRTIQGKWYPGLLGKSAKVGRALIRVQSEETAQEAEKILKSLGLSPRRL